MGEVRDGDLLFDEAGRPCRVIGVTDVMLGRPCNRVVFSDDSEIIADDEHQWLTWDHAARKNSARNLLRPTAGTKKPIVNQSPMVRTTREIRESLLDSSGDANHSIPCAGELELAKTDLPIAPYALGAWLGDGTTLSAGFTCHPDDVQIIDEIQACGEAVQKNAHPNAWSISAGRGKRGNTFLERLRTLGVLGNKHVPAQYLRASAPQRLELLQGLMDTDGYAAPTGTCEFCSTKLELAEAVRELVLSLGMKATVIIGRATLEGRDCGPKYRVKFTTHRPVFRLKRKLERVASRKQRFNTEQRMIVDVIPVDSVPVKCIEVDSQSHLYLAGRAFIPTHNTLFASAIICDRVARGESWGLFSPEYKFTAETYREIDEMLAPIKKSGSKVEGVIYAITGGRVDFWTLNNPNAGRSRKYHGVMIDEAAFAGPDMQAIWEKSIKPALLDYRGVGWALSTPSGKDDDNWFYTICNDPNSGFVEFHAPSSSNPYLPADEIAKLEMDNSPEVYRQEYLAEFVDWTGVAFFPVNALLVDGAPVPMPTKCDTVLAIIDTSIKSGQEHNATAVIWASYNSLVHPPTLILDWDLQQMEGAAQEAWLPSVHARGEELARRCGARQGYSGAMIEDKATGTVLIQQSQNLAHAEGKRSLAAAIDSVLTSLGKDERAIAASKYVYAGDIKITDEAFNKTKIHKGRSANHLISQVTSFRIGSKVKDGLDLLDCFTYLVIVTRGSGSGERKGI